MSLRAPFRRVLLMLALALAARAVRANPELFVDLDYQPDAALDCPSESTFRSMIHEQLGYDPFRARTAQKVVARMHASERGLRGVVEWYDASGDERGERELASDGSDCAALARAMSFAIAVQIQLLAQEAESPMDAAPPKEPSNADSSTPRAAAPVGVPAARPPRDAPPQNPGRAVEGEAPWRFLLGVGPALAVGLAPRTVVLARAFGGVQRGHFALELGAEVSLPVHHATEDGEGFDQRVIAGSAGGCALFGAFSGCLVTKLGGLSVRGFGVDVPNSDSGTLFQVGPRLALFRLFGARWLGALHVEALASLVSWEVTLNQEEVWKTPLVTLSVGGDVALLLQ